MTKYLLYLFLSVSFSSGFAAAEEHLDYQPFFYNEDDLSTIYLDGRIDKLSLWKFSNLLDMTPDATTIALSSPGGDVYSALILAKHIDRMGLHTVVMGPDSCYSACAFLYFAGVNRTAKGKVGVHQISSESPDLNSGQVALADIIELMESFSVSNDVILEMLRTAPEDMHVYDAAELEMLGLTGPRPKYAGKDKVTPSNVQAQVVNLPDLTDGNYSGDSPYGGTISLEIDGKFGTMTAVSPGCSGQLHGFVRRLKEKVGIAAAHCFLSIENGQSGGLELSQGPGCTYYHGFNCSLEGTVRRDD